VGELPPGFTFTLRCVERTEGREFFPTSGAEYKSQAWAGGLALLARRTELSAEERNRHRLMWFLCRRAFASSEHFMNNFGKVKSLRVSRAGQEGAAASFREDPRDPKPSVLPETLGLDAAGRGERWGVGRLLKEGRAEAEARGIQGPDATECLQYGLLRAATLNPLWHIPGDKVPKLIRDALYQDAEVDETPSPGVGQVVAERLAEAFERHLEDSGAHFDAWYWGPKNSLVEQLCKQKKAHGGRLSADVVRQALLDLGWEAYGDVAACIHEMLDTFWRLLPHPLTPAEQRLFAQMHLRQAHFGGLPLVLLAERIPVLTPAVTDAWDSAGDDRAVAVMHRVLHYYAEMARARRDADRALQAKRAGGPGWGTVAKNIDLESAPDSFACHPEEELEGRDLSETVQALAPFASRVRQSRGVRCPCPEPDWEGQLVRFDEQRQTAIFAFRCVRCDFRQAVTVSVAELQGLH
jgi:hypothetical protein